MKIGFFGMSHLGLNYLTASAVKGFKVVGYDTNKNLIDILNSGKKIIKEPGLFENIKKYKKNISFTNKIKNFKICKIIFICSDVPTNNYGKSDLRFIKKNINILKKKFSKKNLVIISQVYPGFTENLKWNKKKLFHQVETLIFGKALNRALNPERIIIGVSSLNQKINNDILKFYKKFKCTLIKTNYKTSELVKISINLTLAPDMTAAFAVEIKVNEGITISQFDKS